MAFERLRTNQALDIQLGKPQGRSDVPWISASSDQNDRTDLKKKAQMVKAGQAMWSREEIHRLLADWVLSNE